MQRFFKLGMVFVGGDLADTEVGLVSQRTSDTWSTEDGNDTPVWVVEVFDRTSGLWLRSIPKYYEYTIHQDGMGDLSEDGAHIPVPISQFLFTSRGSDPLDPTQPQMGTIVDTTANTPNQSIGLVIQRRVTADAGPPPRFSWRLLDEHGQLTDSLHFLRKWALGPTPGPFKEFPFMHYRPLFLAEARKTWEAEALAEGQLPIHFPEIQ